MSCTGRSAVKHRLPVTENRKRIGIVTAFGLAGLIADSVRASQMTCPNPGRR